MELGLTDLKAEVKYMKLLQVKEAELAEARANEKLAKQADQLHQESASEHKKALLCYHVHC